MKKNIHNFKITHILADGTIISDEEFMAKPFVVRAETNQQVIQDIMMILMPEHIKQQKQMERYRKDKERREKLLLELASIGGDNQNET
ncbi:MAG: hypothetical protein ACI4PF_00310 [Christensenellales bacterium]